MTAPDIAATPAWFPHLYDPINDRVLLVAKTEQDYRDAAFLDDRALRADTPRRIVDWPALAAAMPAGSRRDADFIFHIGHVGSTLISRLLGELDSVLALREPAILRTLDQLRAEAGPESCQDPAALPARFDLVSALLSRTFRPEQKAMVKATSFVSENAADLLAPGSRALLLHVAPEAYAATILAGEESRRDLRATAPVRLRRLHARSGARRWNLWEMSEGEKVAMAWATEMTSLAAAEQNLPTGATLWMDFDHFLAAPAKKLLSLAAFFGHDLYAAGAERLARHPLNSRYSKATEYEYGPRARAEALAEARRDHKEAIADGLRWLEDAARAIPAIARCLDGATFSG
jgi:hypothetical protein